MTIRKLIIFLLLLLVFRPVEGQRLLKVSVTKDGKTSYVPSIKRKGLTYISADDFCKSTSINYFRNTKTQKTEIKFKNFNLKFTAKNNFVILFSKADGKTLVYQLPVSTLFVGGKIFIPIDYAAEYLSLAAERKIIFDRLNKSIIFTDNPVNTYAVLRGNGNTGEINYNYDIYGFEVEDKVNGTLLRLKTSRKILLPRGSLDNGKLYLFFAKYSVNPGIDFKNFKSDLIKSISFKSVKGNPQLVISLRKGYSSFDVSTDVDNNDVLVSIHNKILRNPDFENTVAKKWKFDVVVIDPGHGGKDPGSIGVTGKREKDINLAIALKLGELIKRNMKDVKVVYTRKTDRFVELYKRGKIANENNGKLFISIHANSLRKKPSKTRGFEVYLLRPGRTKEAIEIAEFENSVIKFEDNLDRYKKLTDENFILISMARSSFMRFSETFSDYLNNEWTDKVDIPSRGIKQAGFYVLVGASMPGVLIETGFLSNRKDEKYLASKKGQQKIAEAIFEAVLKYKKYYEKSVKKELG